MSPLNKKHKKPESNTPPTYAPLKKKEQRKVKEPPVIAVCSCLAGVNCRYDGSSSISPIAISEYYSMRALHFCPEVLAGLCVPRKPCEIVGGDGLSVLRRKAKVLSADGTDYTNEFITGAKMAYELLSINGIKKIYLKSRSPSCGLTHIYDGTFSGTLRRGMGVCASLLELSGKFELHQLSGKQTK